MDDSIGKENSTSSESNYNSLQHNKFGEYCKIITSSAAENSVFSLQSNAAKTEVNRNSPLNKFSRAPSQGTKIGDKASKTKFSSLESKLLSTETHAKHYTY